MRDTLDALIGGMGRTSGHAERGPGCQCGEKTTVGRALAFYGRRVSIQRLESCVTSNLDRGKV